MQIRKHWMLQQDKLLHAIVGMIGVGVLYDVLSIVCSDVLSLVISFTIMSLVMYGKELVYDKWMDRGVYNIKDFIVGEIGIALQTAILSVLLI